MFTFIIKRTIDTIIVVLVVLTAVFFLSRLSGDPISLMAPIDAPPDLLDRIREQHGLDQPLVIQYFRYILNIFRGDFGTSLSRDVPALGLVLGRIPNSLLLMGTTMLVAIAVAVPLGIYTAAAHRSLFDRSAMVGVVVLQSIPDFWLALMLILTFSVSLGVLPTSGIGTWQQLVLPTLTLAAQSIARIGRLTRSSVLDAFSQQYVNTARAKGLPGGMVLWKHTLRNALIPVVTFIGLQAGALFSGMVITETIFAWPGLGQLLVQSLGQRDYPVVLAIACFTAVAFSVANLLVDITYSVLDPRLAYN